MKNILLPALTKHFEMLNFLPTEKKNKIDGIGVESGSSKSDG
jgi:hypothetical protein